MLRLSLFFVLTAIVLVGESPAQKKSKDLAGDIIKQVLQNADKNGDGKLSPNETSARTKNFIRNAGLNPRQPYAISEITKKAKNKKDDKSNTKENKSKDAKNDSESRRVPGFAVDIKRVAVPDFSPTDGERMSQDAMNRKFGEAIMKQVERTLNRYDKDKDGLIDGSEQKRIRWSKPSPEESDTNGDGNLSKLELAYRFKKRDDNSKGKGKNGKSVSRRNNGQPTSTAKARSQRNTKSSSKINADNASYKRYAEGLMKQYDKDKDSRLSRTEIKEMRRPPENADTNRDGFVDKRELIASISNRSNKSNRSTSKSPQNQLKVKVPRPKKRDDVFGGKDLNLDGQLQMAEYAKVWSEKKVEEFKKKDLNADGVITPTEWQGG